MKRLLVLSLVCLVFIGCNKPGCTDANAVNYDSSANDEDGTCQYVPTLSTMPIIYMNGDTAETGGVISSDGGSDITLRGVCWSTSANPTVADDTTINGSGTGTFNSLITDLQYSTTYFIRAYATNSNGTGYGDEYTLVIPGITTINDPAFENSLIALGYDDVLDGEVLQSNILIIDTLIIDSNNIVDLTGIQDFLNLKYLDCSYNNLTDLDFSSNILLEFLDCGHQYVVGSMSPCLQSLNISNNTLLKYLDFWGQTYSNFTLTAPGLSNLTLLTHLNCHSGYLQLNPTFSSLDLSNQTLLTFLDCSGHSITNLNLSNMPNLDTLLCRGNMLTELDLSNNPSLKFLDVGINDITGLDLSNNPSLKSLYCVFNMNITCLNLSGVDIYQLIFNIHTPSAITCIQLDDPVWATTNFFPSYLPGVTFSTNCNYPAGCF